MYAVVNLFLLVGAVWLAFRVLNKLFPGNGVVRNRRRGGGGDQPPYFDGGGGGDGGG
jgi:uncharacterized membrane protein YgcG